MADGFPVYGPHGPSGVAMKTCTVTGGTFGTDVCLDDCGGYYGDTGDGYLCKHRTVRTQDRPSNRAAEACISSTLCLVVVRPLLHARHV